MEKKKKNKDKKQPEIEIVWLPAIFTHTLKPISKKKWLAKCYNTSKESNVVIGNMLGNEIKKQIPGLIKSLDSELDQKAEPPFGKIDVGLIGKKHALESFKFPRGFRNDFYYDLLYKRSRGLYLRLRRNNQ